MVAAVTSAKLESLRRCIARVRDRCPASADALAKNVDAQDILTLNLTRAVQLCVDIALHEISAHETPIPATMADAFTTLASLNKIPPALALRMRAAVGFRNVSIHQYNEINWTIVFEIATKHLIDFEDFARAIASESFT